MMEFRPVSIAGAFDIELRPISDERGSFTRTFCAVAFARAGIAFAPVQCNRSFNLARATLRGLHLQRAPHGEPKLVECTRGSIFDVAVDLRPDSPTYRRVATMILAADDFRQFYIPEGCAHGFLTLEPESEVTYYMGAEYVADAACGIAWNDPELAIAWPLAPRLISQRDRDFPTLAEWERTAG